MFCMKCGTQMPDDAKFCPKCGESVFLTNNNTSADSQHKEYPIGKWICSKCGHVEQTTKQKCSICGTNQETVYIEPNDPFYNRYVNWGCASQAWFILCIIFNIITVIINIFTKYKDDLLGIMFLNCLATIGVVIAYIGLLIKKQKRYMYMLATLSIVYMGILINLEMSIASTLFSSLANPTITFLILIYDGRWNDMET